MVEPTLLSVAHHYPLPEVRAMTAFYGGKKCVITNNFQSVQWSHMLHEIPENPSDRHTHKRIKRMEERNLCEVRHPRHPAEVRENLIPLSPTQHDLVNQQPPQLTLFLHEDVVARTLAYEQDLQQWRMAELRAGRTDPGRPKYREVFGSPDNATQHRLHASASLLPFHRHGDRVFTAEDCPGPGDPPRGAYFPIVSTLLSTPFSLLHNLPRLVALAPLSVYQHSLVIMSLEIERLWWWDPPPSAIEAALARRARNMANGLQSDRRAPGPLPVQHASRDATTYETMRPRVSFTEPLHNKAHSSSNQVRDWNSSRGTKFGLDMGTADVVEGLLPLTTAFDGLGRPNSSISTDGSTTIDDLEILQRRRSTDESPDGVISRP